MDECRDGTLRTARFMLLMILRNHDTGKPIDSQDMVTSNGFTSKRLHSRSKVNDNKNSGSYGSQSIAEMR